jgi:hypothetical protein
MALNALHILDQVATGVMLLTAFSQTFLARRPIPMKTISKPVCTIIDITPSSAS